MTRGAVIVLWLVACGFRVPAGMPGPDDGNTNLDQTSGETDVVVIDVASDALGAPPPTALGGQRWLFPCTTNLGNNNCTSSLTPIVQVAMLPGVSSQRWMVTARIRGVMEAITYTGGTAGPGGWHVGGVPGDMGNNYYGLAISSPPGVFWLNRGTPTARRSFLYDYTVTFLVDGGATATFTSSGQDDRQWGNYDQDSAPITIAGVTTTPDPYDGQFAQLDVLGAVLQ